MTDQELREQANEDFESFVKTKDGRISDICNYAVERQMLVLKAIQVINSMCGEIDIDQLQPELQIQSRALLAAIDQEKGG